jgi:hypothetical protein
MVVLTSVPLLPPAAAAVLRGGGGEGPAAAGVGHAAVAGLDAAAD